MKTPHRSFRLITCSVASLLAFAVSPRAYCETASRGNAQALLDEAKKNEYERKVAAKQTILDRLSEDQKKGKQEIADLEKSSNKVSSATTEATGQLEKLGVEKKRLTQDLELANLRIEAERLKADGLKLLGIAHAKNRDALAKRTEEIDLRTTVVSAEMQALSAKSSSEPAASGEKASRSKQGPTLYELRRQLARAEQATINATSNARQAMESASDKLQQADSAAAKAEKRRVEISSEGNSPAPGSGSVSKPAKR